MLAIMIIFAHAYQNCTKWGGKRERIELVDLVFVVSFSTNKQSNVLLSWASTLQCISIVCFLSTFLSYVYFRDKLLNVFLREFSMSFENCWVRLGS